MTFSARRQRAALSVALVLTTTPLAAIAADLEGPPPRRREPQYVEPRVFDATPWTGAYIGLSLGSAWGTMGVEGLGTSYSFDNSGVLYGAYAGYTWQAGRLVFGLEADISTGSLGGSKDTGINPVNADLNWLAAARGRLGFLITPSFYLYGMGGLAWADYDLKASTIERNQTFFGYQVGVGGEWRMSQNWSLRLDYLFTDLQKTSKDYPGFDNKYDPDFHTIRAGLTFRF